MAHKVTINVVHCKGCGLCVEVCPKGALHLTGKLSHSGIEIIEFDNEADCTACIMCALMCPDAAVTVEVDEEETVVKK